jgi:Asp-tRNA(Asn)/Glu-tRNA(Gln) amidotransferase A subunit family amidase
VLATFRALFRPGIEAISRAGLAPPGTKSAEAPMTALEWLVARDQSDRLLESFDGWLGDRDALLCPTSISAAFAAGPLGAPVDVDGEAVPSTAVDHACLLATVLGAPALVVPAGRDELGLPVGAQLVGRRWDDCRVVAAGATISSVLGALPPPPFATGGAP